MRGVCFGVRCLAAAALPAVPLHASPSYAAEEQARIEVEVGQGLLTVHAEAAPLADILRIIGEKAGFATAITGGLDTTISWSFESVALDEGIRRLVGGHAMIVMYHPSDGEGPPRIAELRVSIESGPLVDPDRETAGVDKEVLAGLARPRRNARIRAVRRLARSKDDAAVQLLASVLENDEDRFVRGNAAVALGKTKAESATALLAAALEDDAASVRINAVRALGRAGGDRAIWIRGDILLYHPDRNMRWMATRALAEQHSEAALRFLELAATDSDPTVRTEVERSLARWQ